MGSTSLVDQMFMVHGRREKGRLVTIDKFPWQREIQNVSNHSVCTAILRCW